MSLKPVSIGAKKIGPGQPAFIVAEISANHGGSFKKAVSLIREAKKAGADAVKFQTYTPDTITLDSKRSCFRVKHPAWGGQTLHELYKKAHTPRGWFKELKKIADNTGIIFFSTAFDKTAVDLLEELDVPVHKIASFELIDLPLIEYAAKTKKPLIISTGMGTASEIRDAVRVAKKGGAKNIILLKCVTSYPARTEEMNLKTIVDMRNSFNCNVGLSDHTMNAVSSISAVTLGASLLEKHFTLSRDFKTPDSFFSMENTAFRNLVRDIRIAEQSLGRVHYGLTAGQKKMHIYRRSLFAVKDVKKGEVFNTENVKSIRPATGLKPKYIKKIFKLKAKKNIKKGTPLKWDLTGGTK